MSVNEQQYADHLVHPEHVNKYVIWNVLENRIKLDTEAGRVIRYRRYEVTRDPKNWVSYVIPLNLVCYLQL